MQTQHIATLLGATLLDVTCSERLAALLRHAGCCWLNFDAATPSMSQHVATGCIAKRTQYVASNNVAICCVGMLPSFGRAFKQSECSFFLTNTL